MTRRWSGGRARLARLANPLWLLAPLCVAALILGLDQDAPEDARAPPRPRTDAARVLLVIVDSLRPELIGEPSLMPELSELAAFGAVRPVATCGANFTLPCVRTMLEGRQSPFSAGLHNYTGARGGAVSIPQAAARAGIGQVLISDHTLGSLYGAHALESLDTDKLPAGYLDRDLEAVSFAQRALARRDVGFVALHVVGTDKIAHYRHPGAPEYEAHFRAVDRALGELVRSLDLERDSVIVTGDHGHDESGHHTRSSIAVLLGPRFLELTALGAVPEHLDQTEIGYLLSYALGIDLDLGYEGRHLLRSPDALETASIGEAARERALGFLTRQREAFTRAGFDGADLTEAVARHRAHEQRRRVQDLTKAAALTSLFVAWIVGLGVLRSGRDRRRKWIYAIAAIGAFSVGILLEGARAPWIALVTVAGIAGAALSLRDRTIPFLLALVGMGALAGAYAKPWAEVFHTRGGVTPAVVAFYVCIAGVAAGLALLRGGGIAALPLCGLAVGFFVPPSGVYYYQLNQTLLWGFVLGAAVLGAYRAARALRDPGARARLASALPIVGCFAIASVLCLLQEAGGWEYHLLVIDWLEASSGSVAIAFLGGLALAVTLLLPTARGRIAFGVTLAVTLAYSVVIADLGLARLAASLAPILLVASYLRLTGSSARVGRLGVYTDGLLLLASATAIQSALLHGLSIQHIDWSFGYPWFSGLGTSRDTFVALFAVTTIKYGLPVLLLVVTYVAARPRRPLPSVMTAALLFGNLKLATLLLTTAIQRTDASEKLYELTIGDVMITALVMILLVSSYTVAIAASGFAAPNRRLASPSRP